MIVCTVLLHQLDKKRIEEVNVNGTKNLLQGMAEYTAMAIMMAGCSVCVVWSGGSSVHQHTKRGVWGTGDSEDEVPYFPLDKVRERLIYSLWCRKLRMSHSLQTKQPLDFAISMSIHNTMS